jgi:hypothetical protein
VSWSVTEVAADPSLQHLLKDPDAALEWLEEQDSVPTQAGIHAQERAFNRCALVAEMCSAASSRSMLRIQRRFALQS